MQRVTNQQIRVHGWTPFKPTQQLPTRCGCVPEQATDKQQGHDGNQAPSAAYDDDTAPTGSLSGDAERRTMTTKEILMEIEKERVKSGKTLQDFEDEHGIAKSTYQGWLYRYRTPNLETLIPFLDKIGMELIVRRKV